MLIALLSKGRAWAYPTCACAISFVQPGVSGEFESSSENCSLNYAFVIEQNASGSEFDSDSFRTNSSYPSDQIWRGSAETRWINRTNLSMLRQHFATLYCYSDLCSWPEPLGQLSSAPPRLPSGSKSCLRSSCQNARRFFFAARAARVMFPRCVCRTDVRKSCSNCQTTRDFIV